MSSISQDRGDDLFDSTTYSETEGTTLRNRHVLRHVDLLNDLLPPALDHPWPGHSTASAVWGAADIEVHQISGTSTSAKIPDVPLEQGRRLPRGQTRDEKMIIHWYAPRKPGTCERANSLVGSDLASSTASNRLMH